MAICVNRKVLNAPGVALWFESRGRGSLSETFLTDSFQIVSKSVNSMMNHFVSLLMDSVMTVERLSVGLIYLI